MPQYEIYALKYAGPFVRTGAHLMWYRDWEALEKINYYIWCIRGGNQTIVVDYGVTPALARERELEGYVNPAEVLATGETSVWVEAPRVVRMGCEGEAQQTDQAGMVDQKVAQTGHVGLVLVELDEKGGHEGRPALGFGTRPGSVLRPFGKVAPVQLAQQVQVVHGHRTLTH